MQTVIFKNSPVITFSSSVAGPKESEGELSNYFDYKLKDDMYGEKTFEKAEAKILYSAIDILLSKSKIKEEKIGLIIAGDLLNQIISSTFAVRNFNCPYLGIYNACSTFTEALIVGSLFIDRRYKDNIICGTSSHFSSAERQYRYPLELGSVRPPLSQWTVTGAGTCMLNIKGEGPRITMATVGKIVDFGVKDVNDMGAAMAPACADTLLTFFRETKLEVSDFDLIITGDLGVFGTRVFKDLMWEKGYDVNCNHVDCGELIFNINEKEYQGGSGAGCSSLVFCSFFMELLKKKKINRVLLIATGALLSSLSSLQGESIPSIAHLVCIENMEGKK